MLDFEIDSIDGLDENIAGLYEQNDGGKYRLKVNGIEDVSGLKKKMEELLNESKTAKQRAKELEEAQKEAERKSLTEKQEFKTLYEREQMSKTELQKQLEELQGKIRTKSVNEAARSVATSLTKDTQRAELLAEITSRMARYGEDGTVSFEIGGVPVDAAKVEEHLRASYPFLVDGSGATGGGSSGQGGKPGAKVLPRSEVDRMNPAQKAKFFADGGVAKD